MTKKRIQTQTCKQLLDIFYCEAPITKVEKLVSPGLEIEMFII